MTRILTSGISNDEIDAGILHKIKIVLRDWNRPDLLFSEVDSIVVKMLNDNCSDAEILVAINDTITKQHEDNLDKIFKHNA